MRPSLCTVFLVTLATASFPVAAPASFVGLEIPPLPVGCTLQEGMVLGASDAFAYERLVCEEKEIVLLMRSKDRRGKVAYWEAVDELILPTRASRAQALEAPFCRSASHPEDAILAVGVRTETDEGSFVAENISHAWRFDLVEGRIEAISPRDVSCAWDPPD